MLGLLGLGFRARTVVIGVDRVRGLLQAERVVCLVVAADASPRARDKVLRLAQARKVAILQGPPAARMGAQLGRPPVMVAGVLDRALARGLADASGVGAPREG